MALVDVENLRVELVDSGRVIVNNVSLTVGAGEVLGMVGESGSGKTTVALSLTGYTRKGARIARGKISVDSRDVRSLAGPHLQAFRGHVVAYVPQDPSAALNPRIRIGEQIAEALRVHEPSLSRLEVHTRINTILENVSLPSDRAFLRRFPFELSGGQRQRACIATVFLLRPKVVILDEPTTGLDVVTQATVLETIVRLCATYRTAALYVSHDLAVVSNLAHRIVVMRHGRVVESGSSSTLFHAPRHEYTRALIAATPHINDPNPSPSSEISEGRMPILSARKLDAWHGQFRALHAVSLEVYPAECLALVGESGSGKTTLSRVLIGLHHSAAGIVDFQGQSLAFDARSRTQDQRRKLQYIFQSPYNALNNRRSVGDVIATPLKLFEGLSPGDRDAQIRQVLDAVSLSSRLIDRYPSDLSGGERQRVAIARALVLKPSLLICDEITSALDVSVQASIVSLLQEIQRIERLAIIFVTHNLALVRSIAHRTAVLQHGRLVEVGNTDQIINRPENSYTRSLIDHTPKFAEV